jgi:hypothetical protein
MSMAALRWIRPLKVTAPQKVVLWALADQADDKGEAWPSVKGLMEATCLSERTVQGAILGLRAAGLLAVEMGGGRHKTTTYRLLIGTAQTPQEPHDTPQDVPGNGAPETPQLVHKTPQELRETPQQVRETPQELLPNPQEPSVTPKEPSEAVRAKRAARLPADWQLSPELRQFAKAEGLDPDRVAASFRDYWHARPGSGGCKLDWPATFRGWCRREADRRPPSRPAAPEFRNGFLAMIDRERRGDALDPDDEPNPFLLALEAPHRGH